MDTCLIFNCTVNLHFCNRLHCAREMQSMAIVSQRPKKTSLRESVRHQLTFQHDDRGSCFVPPNVSLLLQASNTAQPCDGDNGVTIVDVNA